MTVQQLGQTVTVEPGGYVVKPRNTLHTFWNAGSNSLRILEIIAPGELAAYFVELDGLFKAGQVTPEDPSAIIPLAAKYGIEMDFGRVPQIMQEFGVRMG